jgi:uncharacterized protein YndB with AHSA1/START domain
MPSAKRDVVIHRQADQVFAFFTDPANDRRWRTHVKEIAAEGPIAAGARIHQVVKGPGGGGILADIEVTAHEPPTHYAFRVTTGPVRPVGEFTFTPDGDDTTVSFSLSADLTGIKRLFMSRPVQSSMDGEVAALDTAKAIIEGA